MFDIPVNKIGELDEYDFENLVSILESDSLEEWFSERHLDDSEEVSAEPPKWLKEWSDFLKIHSLCFIDNGIVWTEINLIEDAREGVFFIFHKDNDNCSLGDRTPRSIEDQSTQVVWSLVKQYFDRFGESVLYGTLEIHDTALLPQVLLEPYLAEKMAAEGVKELGDGVSLKSWIKSNYR